MKKEPTEHVTENGFVLNRQHPWGYCSSITFVSKDEKIYMEDMDYTSTGECYWSYMLNEKKVEWHNN